MIDVSNLTFTYPNSEEKTLKGLDFNIKKGEIFGFLGPSGAGKSTTQKVIIGILKNYHGNVKVMGKEISSYNNDYFEKIGVAFEFPNLYKKFTGLENLNFFQSLYKNQETDPLKLMELVGLKKDRDLRVERYSKGMKMRLNFCRALLNDPEIIFLDEPTSGLDPVNARNIKDVLLAKKEEGKTIFLTTHNMNTADELCDRVAFINDGRLGLVGNPRDLKLKYGKKIVNVEYINNGDKQIKSFSMENLGENRNFFELISKNKIETIHSQETTLEDIFIRVTGSELK